MISNTQDEIVCVIRDITEQKHAANALKESEQLLRDIFNMAPVPLIISNITDGKIIMANEKSELMAGLHSESLIGKHVDNYYINQQERQQLLNRIIRNGKVEGIEITLKNAKGQINLGLVSTTVINLNGEKRLFTGFIDITERKKMEADLNVSFDLVREQNKRLLNFSYIVSHNLRSHTSNITTILDFLENATAAREREEMIGHLRTVTGRLDDTLFDLNEVVSIQKNINLIIEPLVVYEYVERAIQVLRELINLKKSVINIHIPKEVIISYNPAYLESIVLNLLSNALKYSHPNRQSEISIRYKVDNNRTILEISDNGLGIDLEKNRDKIFGMYKTFHGNKDAKGLGLFITKNQVEAMGGALGVESKPNIGTTFKITIV
jgi:PAS domain S-box-containing protein